MSDLVIGFGREATMQCELSPLRRLALCDPCQVSQDVEKDT